jgi:twitching motility two-component system response regulator PilG
MSAGASFNGVTVMVIDDSNTIRRSAEIFLGKTGAKVVLAEDGFDALAKIADHQPDLIFCDVLMPRLDGYQTCALIKKSPKFKTTPVVMLSSKDGLFDKAKGRMVGSDHYLTKPFTKDSLLQAVTEFARRASPATGVDAVRLSSGVSASLPSTSSAASSANAASVSVPVAGLAMQSEPAEPTPSFSLNFTAQFADGSETPALGAMDIVSSTEKFTLSLV